MKINPRVAGVTAVTVLALLVPTVLLSQSSSRPKTPVVMDAPEAEERLNRELWEWTKKTPYETALRHVEQSQAAQAAQSGTVQLPTGWSNSPVGTQVTVGDLPFEMISFAGHTVVLNTGARGPQTLSVVDPASGQLVRTVEVEGLFPSARVAPDGALYLSGGFTKKIYRYNSEFAVVRAYTVPGYATGIAVVDDQHLAVAYFGAPVADGLFNPGGVAILNTETGQIEKQVSLSGLEPYGIEAIGGKFYVTIPGGNRLAVLNRDLQQIASLALGRSPQQVCREGNQLYVVNANSDSLSRVDTATDTVTTTLPVRYKQFPLGSAATSCTVANGTLYVTLANANAIAVLDAERGKLRGFIPAGWYPTRVLVENGNLLYLSAKGIVPRQPNPGYESDPNQYVLNLLIGSLGIIPAETVTSNLGAWTAQVNNSSPLFAPSGSKTPPIRHVFYIVKENRTYDQVLGDLGQGNGDPELTLFGREITPAHHALAEQFVTLDNFFANGEVSTTGHSITASAYVSPYLQLLTNFEYSGRYSGSSSVDPSAYSVRYLWDALNERQVSFRIYGELVYFNALYLLIVERFGADSPLALKFRYLSERGFRPGPQFRPLARLLERYAGQAKSEADLKRLLREPAFVEPFSRFFTGDSSLERALAGNAAFRAEVAAFLAHYDLRYRPFDLSYSDLDRVATWKTDFTRKVRLGRVEQFQYLILPNDHTSGDDPDTRTPSQYLAQNDAAFDVIVRTIAASPIWKDSLILVVEDDAQDGPDHVDARRTIAYAIGPHIKRGAVVSDLYDQVGMVRTIELILGLRPLNMTDALAVPMLGVFTPTPDLTGYTSPPPSTYLTPEDLARYQQLIGG